MNTVKLVGKSMKGKNRVREHGSVWTVHVITEKVLFNPQPGPWLFVSPLGRLFQDKASRWVHQTDDQDFIVDSEAEG